MPLLPGPPRLKRFIPLAGWRLGSGVAGRDRPRGGVMATEKQKEAARRNIGKAREAQSARAHGKNVPRSGEGMSTAEKDKLADGEFAFPDERKEPLTDARHVRNAIARFNQVERDKAWQRILAAAKRYDVEVSESGWRELAKGGKDRKR